MIDKTVLDTILKSVEPILEEVILDYIIEIGENEKVFKEWIEVLNNEVTGKN